MLDDLRLMNRSDKGDTPQYVGNTVKPSHLKSLRSVRGGWQLMKITHVFLQEREAVIRRSCDAVVV